MMRSRRLLPIVVACGVVFVAVSLTLGWFDSAPKRVQLRPDDAALTARGEQVYREHCASCHGARLEGQPDWRARGLSLDTSIPGWGKRQHEGASKRSP